MIGASSARAADKTPMFRTDASIAASVLSAIVSGTEIGKEIAIETASAVTGIDETKRIAIVKARGTVISVVELFSPLRTVVSQLEWVIAPWPPLRTSWGSEEDLLTMTYVSPPLKALLFLFILSCPVLFV